MNCTNLIGHATNNATIKYINNDGRPMAEFTLAVADTHGRKNPETGHHPSFFFPVYVWGTKAEIAAAKITKGRRIGVSGRLVQNTFTPMGHDRPITVTRVIAESFDLLEKPHHETESASD